LKKIIAILFIGVYLFNLVGYSLTFDYFIHQADNRIVQQLDNNDYNEAELLEIKIPLNLPYYTSWDEYERYDGEIVLNGIHYNYVKRKVVNDTLFLLCLPDHVKTELYKAKSEFAYTEGDNDSSSKKGMESFGKKNNFKVECNQQGFQYSFLTVSPDIPWKNICISNLLTCFIPPPAEPPEIV